jgi:hypothetical protein
MEIHSDWCTPFMIYLKIEDLPDHKIDREQLCRQAGQYNIVGDELFW